MSSRDACSNRTVSPRFFNSLVVSPIEGWIVVRGNLSGTKFTAPHVIHSELGGTYEIMGPATLGKGFTVRQGTKNDLIDNLRMDGRLAAE